jgi:hypothetical protein
MVTTIELKNWVLKHYRVKRLFCRNFPSPFQKWTFLKMSNFQNLTTTFPRNFVTEKYYVFTLFFRYQL